MVTAQELGLNPERYKVFEGTYREIMPQLLNAGFTSWGSGDVMEHRTAAVGQSHEGASFETYFDTDCGIAGDKQNIYVAPCSPRLRSITLQTRLADGGIPLPKDDLPAGIKVYDRGEFIVGRDLTENEARESKFWLDQVDGDQTRLDTYVENTFRLGKNKCGYDTMMGIYVPENEWLIERFLFLSMLSSRSRANGENCLRNRTRFVGVCRGASVSEPGRTLETSVQAAIDAGIPFR